MAQTYNPQIVISAAPGITGFLRLVLYEATAPNTEVAASEQLAPPHFTSRSIQFIGRRPVIHLAKLFVTDGVAPTGTLIADFAIDPRYPGVEVKAPLYIYAGQTPGFDVGENFFADPDGELDGWVIDVDIRGFGRLNPDTEFTKTEGAGYVVDIPGYQLQPDELHIISFSPKLVTYAGEPEESQLFKAVRIVTSDTFLSVEDVGKLVLAKSATSRIQVVLPDFDAVAEAKTVWINSQGGSHKNLVVIVAGLAGEKISYQSQAVDQIILGQNESIVLVKHVDGSSKTWEIANDLPGIGLVGKILFSYEPDPAVNTVPLQGQLLDRDIYTRLYQFVLGLDSDSVVSDSVWLDGTANRGKFSFGNGSTTFRVPDADSPGFYRVVDGLTRKAGSFQAEMIGPHTHPTPYRLNDSRGGDQQNTVYDGTDTGSRPGASAILANAGTENRPANTGVYAFIRI
jgi:hypothetical protein